MVEYIRNYLKKTTTYSPGRFIFEMYLVALILKVIVLISVVPFAILFESLEYRLFGDFSDGTSQFDEYSFLSAIILMCIVMPFFESIFFQGIPILTLSYLTQKRFIYIFISSLIFTAVHSTVYISFIFILFSAGIVFAWCFINYYKKSFWKAIMITTAVHGLYNLTGTLSYYIF